MQFGTAEITEGYDTADNPPDSIIENGGWVSMQIASLTENLVAFNAAYMLSPARIRRSPSICYC